jgi:RimJ/RimL family protein N-acetyltransferase
MTMGEPARPTSRLEPLLSRAEEWIYALNERGHWIFRLYDWGNEVWAHIRFGPLRRRASEIDVPIPGKTEVAHMRFLTPDDLDDFAALLASFDFEYLPPHPLDRSAAERALLRRSYIPLGIFLEGDLVGYLLLRLFFVKRAVLGIWSKTSHQNRGFTRSATKAAAEWTRSQGVPNYITVPIGNTYSLRVGLWAGWKILRTNRRFHVLLYLPDDS